jgi:hypothetical protein
VIWGGLRSSAVNPERAAEVEITLGLDATAFQAEFERGRDGPQRHAGAGYERFQEHVAGASLQARAAGRRMQPRLDERPACIDAASDAVRVETAFGAQGNDCGVRMLPIFRLQRRLQFPQTCSVH